MKVCAVFVGDWTISEDEVLDFVGNVNSIVVNEVVLDCFEVSEVVLDIHPNNEMLVREGLETLSEQFNTYCLQIDDTDVTEYPLPPFTDNPQSLQIH
ncbi:TPA: hypothetical protein ACPVXB_005065 [Vibrio parahaemolyticus]